MTTRGKTPTSRTCSPATPGSSCAPTRQRLPLFPDFYSRRSNAQQQQQHAACGRGLWRWRSCQERSLQVTQEGRVVPAPAPLLWYGSSMLESASRQQLHSLLGSLETRGELSQRQARLAAELAAELDLGQLAPDLVAASLLVLLARAEGRVLSAAHAGRAVRAACGSGQCRSVAAQVSRMQQFWKGNPQWLQLLGPPVTHGGLTVQQARGLLVRLAAEGPPQVARWAPLAEQALGSVGEAGPEAAGNLAGGLLVLMSRVPPLDGVEGPGASALSPGRVARAIQALGGEASPSGVLYAARRLEKWRGVLGLPPPPPTVEVNPQRAQQLAALLGRLQAVGEVAGPDVPLLVQLAGSLPEFQWPVGTLAAALLVVLGRARGRAVGLGQAAAAVRGVGGETGARIAFHIAHLLKHWEADTEWQALLGPPKGHAEVARERLDSLLCQVSQLGTGALHPSQLSTALQLAADLRHAVIPLHLTGAVVGALLMAAAGAQGGPLGMVRAVEAVQAAGGEASAQGIATQLPRLWEHWQGSEVWQQVLGQPPPTPPWDTQPAMPLLTLLSSLAEHGHLDSALAPAAEALAQRTLALCASARGNFAAALLVLAAAAGGQQLAIRQAVERVNEAGGSASCGRAGRLLRKLRASWEAGDAEWEALLGPYEPSDTDTLPQLEALLEQLCSARALPALQLPAARQLAGSLVGRSRQPWRAGNMAGAVLVVLAAAEGQEAMRPAQAAAVVRGVGAEASPPAVLRHKLSALKLWQSREDWQALLGPPPLPHPPTRTTVSGLLRELAERGALPPSQLPPALTLARNLKVPQDEAGAVAVAVAVGWAQATGRSPSIKAVAAAATEAGAATAPADVRMQLGRLQERWGPPCSWAEALHRPDPAQQHQQQCWRQLAVLLMRLERSHHLLPGQAAKALFLAQKMQVWTGLGPSQKPGNVAGALLLVVSAAGVQRVTCKEAVAAVRAAGAAAFPGSVTKWRGKCMQLWRESQEWQTVLGVPPQNDSDEPAAAAPAGVEPVVGPPVECSKVPLIL